MSRRLTTYVKNPMISAVDRQTFRRIAAHFMCFRLKDGSKELYWWMHNNLWRFLPYQIIEKKISRGFDKQFGTDTLQRVNITDLQTVGPNSDHGVYYQASPVLSTRRIIRDLDIQHQDFTFLDFGSGKGRTLLIASEFHFNRVIGIEFGLELHTCALDNIIKYKQLGICRPIEVTSVHTDATKFSLPEDNLVMYFFNPFDEVIIKKVINNIAQSLINKPRKAYIIYRYLPNHDLINKFDGFTLIRDWKQYRVYRWDPIITKDNANED